MKIFNCISLWNFKSFRGKVNSNFSAFQKHDEHSHSLDEKLDCCVLFTSLILAKCHLLNPNTKKTCSNFNNKQTKCMDVSLVIHDRDEKSEISKEEEIDFLCKAVCC